MFGRTPPLAMVTPPSNLRSSIVVSGAISVQSQDQQGADSPPCAGDSTENLHSLGQLLVVADGQLNVSWYDA